MVHYKSFDQAVSKHICIVLVVDIKKNMTLNSKHSADYRLGGLPSGATYSQTFMDH